MTDLATIGRGKPAFLTLRLFSRSFELSLNVVHQELQQDVGQLLVRKAGLPPLVSPPTPTKG
jgi:hypothetical protein